MVNKYVIGANMKQKKWLIILILILCLPPFAFISCTCFFVNCTSQGELYYTVQFADEITGHTFERERWIVNSFPGGTSAQIRFYEITDGSPARIRVRPLLYERYHDAVYGGITLHSESGSRYTLPLSEPYPFSLSLEEASIRFVTAWEGLEVLFSISEDEATFHFSSILQWAGGGRTRVRSDAFELELSEAQLQDVLRSLERSEHVPRLTSDARDLSSPGTWTVGIAFLHHTTFFHIDGEEAYQLLRYYMNHPIDQADPAEVSRLREIYNETRLQIQEARAERTVTWHEKNNSWDRNAGAEVREAALAELRAISEYYNAIIQAYFEEGLQSLAVAYEDSRSNVSFEYLGFKTTLIVIFELTS